MSTIAIERLTKQFDDVVAVNDVSLEIGANEMLVIVGPSGCGKTTLLRLLAGLEAPTSGKIQFGERVVNKVRPRDRNVSMVFQNYALFPALNVYNNIAYGLQARGFPKDKIRSKVMEAAEMLRLEDNLERKPSMLSGGQQQRVALARAYVRTADLYLFDEPLANLDVPLRQQARTDILALHKRKGRPSVYVTHDQAEAMALGDRIAVMRDGKIVQIGSSDEIYSRPNSKFIAYFIGTPSINFWEGTVLEKGDTLRLKTEHFEMVLPDSFARVRPLVGKTVTVGVRPEDLHSLRTAEFETKVGNTLNGTIELIEALPYGSAVYLMMDDQQLVTATMPTRVPNSYMGRTIELGIDMEKIHLFDVESEQVI